MYAALTVIPYVSFIFAFFAASTNLFSMLLPLTACFQNACYSVAKSPSLALGALRVIGLLAAHLSSFLCSLSVFASAVVDSTWFLCVCVVFSLFSLFSRHSRLVAPSVRVAFLLHLANSCWPPLEISVGSHPSWVRPSIASLLLTVLCFVSLCLPQPDCLHLAF